MDKESPLKTKVCSKLIAQVIVAEPPLDADKWGMWVAPW